MKNLMLLLDYIPQLAGLMLRALFRSKWLMFTLFIGLAYYLAISYTTDRFIEIQDKMNQKYEILIEATE